MKQYKLVIFDLDGTLINTVADLNTAVNYALDSFHYPTRSIEQTTRDIGNGVAKLIERSIPNGINNPDYKQCLATFRSYYRKHYFDKSLPYDGVKETLLAIKERGYTLAVVSNKFDEGAKSLVNHFFPNIFSYIQGHALGYQTKPAPDMVNHVLDELGFDQKEAIYVGDTDVDYQTAINSQIPIILVSYGYRNRLFLETNIKGATIVDAPNELLNILL